MSGASGKVLRPRKRLVKPAKQRSGTIAVGDLITLWHHSGHFKLERIDWERREIVATQPHRSLTVPFSKISQIVDGVRKRREEAEEAAEKALRKAQRKAQRKKVASDGDQGVAVPLLPNPVPEGE